MYPIMLPGPTNSNDGFSSFRNPDSLFPERQGTPPDRLGTMFVRLLELVSDGWYAIRRPKGEHQTASEVQEAARDGTPVFRSQ